MESKILVPAILYKEQIVKEFKKLYYTEDMLFLTGTLDQWYPDIQEKPVAGKIDYAIIDNNELIGYLTYQVDFYTSKVDKIGIISFDRGNPNIGRYLYEELEKLTASFHKIEWDMISGNPAERSYDNFCKKHKGEKHILKDFIKDKQGNYRNLIIYEVLQSNKEA